MPEPNRPISPAASEEYADYIIEYNGDVERLQNLTYAADISILNERYAILHVSLNQYPLPQIDSYTYNVIPKCYSFMDTQNLNASGFTRLHNHPYLSLRGRGVLIAILDSGERVIIMSKSQVIRQSEKRINIVRNNSIEVSYDFINRRFKSYA